MMSQNDRKILFFLDLCQKMRILIYLNLQGIVNKNPRMTLSC